MSSGPGLGERKCDTQGAGDWRKEAQAILSWKADSQNL